MLKTLVTAHSQRGVERKENQDALGIKSWRNIKEFKDSAQFEFLISESPHLFLLADGIGGHEKGGAASHSVIDHLFSSFLLEPKTFEISSSLLDAHLQLNEFKNGISRPRGTTILGLIIDVNRAIVFNVGDSKGYRARDHKLTQLTIEDRTLGGQNALTQCIGGGANPPKSHVFESEIMAKDKFVLLSDGITDFVSDDEILSLILKPSKNSASSLCARALYLGSGDDLSAIVIEFS